MFWNINKSVDCDTLAALSKELQIDVILLAECHHEPSDLRTVLHKHTGHFFNNFTKTPNRVSFYSRLGKSAIEPVFDSTWLTLKNLQPTEGQSILIGAIHFTSKTNKGSTDQAMLMHGVREEIDRAEKRNAHSRTILIGDFNQNPFELGLTNAHSIHAVMTKERALKQTHKVDHTVRKYFYNPMWSLIGDESIGPPGTYHYPQCPKHIYWHTFDQALMRPALLTNYKRGDVRVVEKIGNLSLIKNDVIDKKISDHLPIVAKINK